MSFVYFQPTAAQLGIWRAQQIDPQSPTYNTGEYAGIRGRLDVEKFEQAARTAVGEMETLRLRFQGGFESPEMWVDLSSDPQIDITDLSTLENPAETALERMHADMRVPFDLTADLLFKGVIFKLSDDHFFWYYRIHHIVSDGVTFTLLWRRMTEIYRGLLSGAEVAPEVCSISTLVDADAAYKASDGFQLDKGYWEAFCSGLSEAGSLSGKAPSGPPPTPVRSMERVDTVAVGQFRDAARRLRTNLGGLCIAAAAVQLRKTVGSDEVVVGVPVSGRRGPTLTVPGMMSNVVLLKIEFSAGLTVSRLLKRIADGVREALRHQNHQYEDMRREAGVAPWRDLYSLTVNPMTFDYAPLDGCDVRFHTFGSVHVNDLSISIYDRASIGQMYVAIDANPDLYSPEDNDRNLHRFLTIIGALAESNADDLVDGVPVLSAAERERALVEWNDTGRAVGSGTLPSLFRAQVEAAPEAVALVFGETSVSYGDLNARADRLARYLVGCGVGPERLVAVFMDRSVESVVALLAIVKAGGAYVPIDPRYPVERVRYMLDDARPVCVLTHAQTRGLLPDSPAGGHEALRIDLDDQGTVEAVAAQSATDPGLLVDAAHPAYVIYTSGSTGRPKGVAVTHAGIASLAAAQAGHLGVERSSRVLQFASASFDAAFWELAMALLQGAALVMASAGQLEPGRELARLVARHGVTHATLPPAVLPALDAAGGLKAPVTLVVAGEACPAEVVERWSAGHRMINAYGPTETTVCATMSDPLHGAGVPPIGRPVWNTRVYVLDAGLEPVPPGVDRRTLRGGIRSGPGVCGSGGADRGTVRGVSVRRPGGADVPDGGPGPVARGREPGVRRPGRRPGQGPGVPGRARRDPDGARRVSSRAPGGGGGPGGRPG